MKNLKTVMLVVVMLLVPVYALSANLGYMRISLIEGDVQIKTPDADDWGYASVNTPLEEGDQVWVPQDGRAELQLNTGTYVRLDQNSALQILSIDKDSSQFYLSQGNVYFYYRAPRGSVIQVDTPDASTRAFDKAIFRIDISDQYQYTDVAVYKGFVETENEVGKARINAGQMVSLGHNTDGEVAPMGPPDEWEKWNKKRNDRIFARRGASSRYLPSELSAYSSDFDSHGRWVQVPDYGYVWKPTIVIGASWSPYRDGRWIWRGGDYIWVGSEPWGWAPYHYGRWSFGANIGWFWVPPVTREVYWSPGYVGWVRTPEYVAWVPLAPGEIYYGRGNYGRHSVNIINVNINQVNITNVYKNVTINNGVTVVNRSSFNTGRPTIVNVNKNVIQNNIFIKNNISIGTPDIKPTKASYFKSDKSISQVNLPPQHIRNIQVKELKHSRRLIKDQAKSVLNPDEKPKALPVKTVTKPRTPGKEKPSIQQVKPEERKKPAGQEDRRRAIEDRKQLKTEEKEIKSEEKKRLKTEEKEVKSEERVKSKGPVVSPTDKGEKQQIKHEEKRKPTGTEDRRGAIEEKKRLKAKEKEVKPEDKEVKPEERKKPAGPEDRRGTIEERKRLKTEEKELKSEEKELKTKEKDEKDKEKEKQEKPECGPGEKDEKDPEKCPQEN